MGNITIKDETNNARFDYQNGQVIVEGDYSKTKADNSCRTVSGSVFHQNGDGSRGVYMCGFNGRLEGSRIKYSLTEVACADAVLAWEAIAEIEENLTAEEEEGGEA